MYTLEPELKLLQSEGVLDEAAAATALAADRRDLISVQFELRAAMYAGVLLVMGGVGLLLARNLDRIGPLAIALGIALVALICAIPAVRSKFAGQPLSAAGDYLLLLAALLASADLAYVEAQFKVLGPLWSWHLLWLALAHAVLAYAFRSSLVLAASLTSLAGWFGATSTVGDVFSTYSAAEVGVRALACAGVITAWRVIDQRMNRGSLFTGTFDHFAANLAFIAAVAWCVNWPGALAGLLLLAGLAFVSIRHAFDAGRESFLVYGVLYAALGLCVAVVPHIDDFTAACALVLVVVGAAATALWQMRQQLREPVA